jgi:hypothetical protein
MLGTARLPDNCRGAVALLLARYLVGGTQVALLVAVGVATFGAALSTLPLSPTGVLGARRERRPTRATGASIAGI